MTSFFCNGVELCRDDFQDDLLAHVAFRIGMTAATQCKDKASALKMLEWEARGIIESIRAGEPVWTSDVVDGDDPREGLKDNPHSTTVD
jgi:hypothetical protein